MAKQLGISFSAKFKKQYKKLPRKIKNKFSKQLKLLQQDYRYSSLRTKKMKGYDIFEARIDLHNRFTFEISGNFINLLSIGPHDTGLDKK